jgi:hypothetical protein
MCLIIKKKKTEIENIMYFPVKAKAVHLVATKTAEMGYKVQNSHLCEGDTLNVMRPSQGKEVDSHWTIKHIVNHFVIGLLSTPLERLIYCL